MDAALESGSRRPGRSGRRRPRRRARPRPPSTRSAELQRGICFVHGAFRRFAAASRARRATECATNSGFSESKLARLMRAVTHAHAGAAGVQRHLQVMRGVADHQRALRLGAELVASVRAACAGAACRRSRRRCASRRTCPCSCDRAQAHRPARGATCRWPPPASDGRALAGRPAGAARRRTGSGRPGAQVVVAVARAEFGVLLLGHVGRGMGQRLASGPGRSRRPPPCPLGMAPPTSTTARWMQRTMILVESNRVPSQSKAIRSNWRGAVAWAWSAKLLAVPAAAAASSSMRSPVAG